MGEASVSPVLLLPDDSPGEYLSERLLLAPTAPLSDVERGLIPECHMDLQTWGILLFFFGLPYIIWISAQFKGESPGSALGIVSLVLVANVAVPIAFATFMHWSLGLGVFLLGLLFIRFMRNRDVRTQGPFLPPR